MTQVTQAVVQESAPNPTPVPASPTPPPTEAQTEANRQAMAAKGKAKIAKAKKPAPKGKKAGKKAGKSGPNKGITGPAVLKTYAPDYVKGGKDGKAKTSGGNLAIDNGDKLSEKLRGKPLSEVYEMAVKAINSQLEEGEKEVSIQSLKLKYNKLNVGMQRMNLGNRIRAILYPKK